MIRERDLLDRNAERHETGQPRRGGNGSCQPRRPAAVWTTTKPISTNRHAGAASGAEPSQPTKGAAHQKT
jgi:hypothetical protein